MMELLRKLWGNENFRYILFGSFTVFVNILTYQGLSLVCGDMVSNTIAFFVAVLFAYWSNSALVFRTSCTWKNFSQFMGMRIGTLFIDNGGMYLFLLWGVGSLKAKCVINVIIIGINYLMSKLIIFRRD